MSTAEKSMLEGGPLVTFAVVTYNQEAFIREALEAAFAQTYSPLEIIVSDDCSTDSTYQICVEVAASYRGPHTIRLNQNKSNLGLTKHSSVIPDIASGELIVGAAGDDVSLPERTEILVEKWLEYGRPMGIGSSATIIDRHGKQIGVRQSDLAAGQQGVVFVPRNEFVRRYVAGESYWLLGATAAWSADCWKLCGALDQGCIAEDASLSFRAGLHSGLCAIDEPLVLYRTHDHNVTFGTKDARPKTLAACKQRLRYAQAKARWSARNLVSDELVVEMGVRDGWLEEQTATELIRAIQERTWRLEKACKWWDLSPMEKLVNLSRPLYREWYRNVASLLGLQATASLMAFENRIRAIVDRAK